MGQVGVILSVLCRWAIPLLLVALLTACQGGDIRRRDAVTASSVLAGSAVVTQFAPLQPAVRRARFPHGT